MPSWRGWLGRARTRTFRSAEREAERCKLAVPGDRCRGHRRARWQWGMVAAAVLPLLGCVTYPTELVPATPSAETAPDLYHPALESEYLIEAGDNLLIQSYYDPLLKQTATVRPDGRISLLLVGDIQAAGKTPSELHDRCCKASCRPAVSCRAPTSSKSWFCDKRGTENSALSSTISQKCCRIRRVRSTCGGGTSSMYRNRRSPRSTNSSISTSIRFCQRQ